MLLIEYTNKSLEQCLLLIYIIVFKNSKSNTHVGWHRIIVEDEGSTPSMSTNLKTK